VGGATEETVALRNPDQIDVFLSGYPGTVAALAGQLRAVVKAAVPGCTETLHAGWKVVSYGQRKKFCAIAPHQGWVNLQFHAGAALADPHHLLRGTGKSMRHVKISQLTDLSDGLNTLARQAGESSK
jgi:hypothetical protein